MKGYSKTNVPESGLPTFLASLRERAGLSLRAVADRTSYKYQAIFQIETRTNWGSVDVARAHARACGAFPLELATVDELHALGTGWIRLPVDVTAEQVRNALAALKGGE
jgi:transcriptional regulator with XRE-family HTH domain